MVLSWNLAILCRQGQGRRRWQMAVFGWESYLMESNGVPGRTRTCDPLLPCGGQGPLSVTPGEIWGDSAWHVLQLSRFSSACGIAGASASL